MKLRIKGDSVRFRVAPSEVNLLLRKGKLTSQVRFSLRPRQSLLYTLVLDENIEKAVVSFTGSEIIARLPQKKAAHWASTDAVGISAEMELGGASSLSLLVEKDFACLDLSDKDNEDTYPNPNAEQVC